MEDDKKITCDTCGYEFSYCNRIGGDNQCFCPKCEFEVDMEDQ